MKNTYIVKGDVVEIDVGGEVCLVDKDDFIIADRYPGLWHLSTGYAVGSFNVDGLRHPVRLHRLIACAPESLIVDHINHNRLDNRKENLRLGTQGLNVQNIFGPNKNNITSKHRGVSFRKNNGKWRAYCAVNKKQTHLGYFDTAAVAAAYRKKHFPFAPE